MGVIFFSRQHLYQALPLQQQFLQAPPLQLDQVIWQFYSSFVSSNVKTNEQKWRHSMATVVDK